MTKIAINTAFGGFCLTDAALEVCRSGGLSIDRYGRDGLRMCISRDHPILIQTIEGLGHKASFYGSVKIVEIPDEVDDWYIIDYDGLESVHEGRQWSADDDN